MLALFEEIKESLTDFITSQHCYTSRADTSDEHADANGAEQIANGSVVLLVRRLRRAVVIIS